jgi:nucleotide-binding universal stress UspA family protein
MTNVRTILVPVDFTPGSLAAAAHARDLASIFKSRVHLLHCATVVPAWALEVFGSHLQPVHEQHRLNALDRLAALMVSLHFDPTHTTGLVRMGPAERIIAEYAAEMHADLIIMGTHGDHSLMTLGVGRVVERVLSRVRCPVLTIPEPDAVMPQFASDTAQREAIAS